MTSWTRWNNGVQGGTSSSGSDYVSKAGDTMTGTLTGRTDGIALQVLEMAANALSMPTPTEVLLSESASGVDLGPQVLIQRTMDASASASNEAYGTLIRVRRLGTNALPDIYGLGVVADSTSTSVTPGSVIGILGHCTSETSSTSTAFGVLALAQWKNSAAGAAVGLEVDVVNETGVDSIDPNGATKNFSIGVNVASFTRLNGSAIVVQGSWIRGLDFWANSLGANAYGIDFNRIGNTTHTPIRLANATYVKARNAADSADVDVIGLNASNQVVLGAIALATTPSLDDNSTKLATTAFVRKNQLKYASVADSTAIANTAASTAFSKSYTIPAGTLAAGDMIRITACGTYASTGSPTTTLTAKVGGQIVSGIGGLAVSGGTGRWELIYSGVVRAIGASGTLKNGFGIVYTEAAGFNSNGNSNALTVDTTGTLAVEVFWQWSAADPANTATMTQLLVEVLGAGATS
jgi:hypothetical protein